MRDLTPYASRFTPYRSKEKTAPVSTKQRIPVPFRLFGRGEVASAQAAGGADPIFGDILPGCAGGYTVFGVAQGGVVDIPAGAFVFHSSFLSVQPLIASDMMRMILSWHPPHPVEQWVSFCTAANSSSTSENRLLSCRTRSICASVTCLQVQITVFSPSMALT